MLRTIQICLIPAFVLLMGCQNKQVEAMNSKPEIASGKKMKRFEKTPYKSACEDYNITGKVIKVENHPVSPFSSAGTHAITYHIKYELNGPLSPHMKLGIKKNDKKTQPKTYIIPITEYDMFSKYKVGDMVRITGVIKKQNPDK